MHTKPALVGIVNVTPDSFSDGRVRGAQAVLEQVKSLIESGAAVVDIGAESTRPGANVLTDEEEWQRLEPVLKDCVALCHAAGRLVSVDTYHAHTAQRALALGVDWINDVTGFSQPAMVQAVQHSDCRLVMMHALGIPADPTVVLPDTAPASLQVARWATLRLAALGASGIDTSRVILDPGVGFGKTALQSLEILMNTRHLLDLGCELLIGHSRKSFLTLFTQAPAQDRDELTLSFSALLSAQQVHYLRVHNVKAHADLWSRM